MKNSKLLLLVMATMLSSCDVVIFPSNSNNVDNSNENSSEIIESIDNSSPKEESSLVDESSTYVESSTSTLSSESISTSEDVDNREAVEILKNTDFNDLSPYTIWGDSIVGNKVGNDLVLSVNNNNPTDNWSTQFLQKGLIFPKGEFKFIVELTSSMSRSIDFIIQKDGTNNNYSVITSGTEAFVANQKRTVEYTFSTNQIEYNMQFGILTGKVGGNQYLGAHTITISKLSLLCYAQKEDTPIAGEWQLTFADEFDGNSVDESKWEFQIGDGSQYGVWRWGNDEKQYYRKENSTVSDGTLKITAKKESYGGYQFTSSRLRTFGKFSQTYGKFEARMKLPSGTGMWPAFWMLPENSVYGNWPDSGEIDIMEARGRQTDRYDTTLHFSKGGHVYRGTSTAGLDITMWHVYGIEWTKDYIKWTLDGSQVFFMSASEWSTDNNKNANATNSSPFDQDFHILLNFAVGGNYDGGRMPEDSFTLAVMEVDYVRAYKMV